ncbi:hypothetical protein [Streptomyces mangrovisoli]|uniref:Calcium-binding protein n=1 Tax=Streptomyces mangrovisoli TaxID=1428628 RepID=A0A1J4NR57_9ACTN|nr:hypothetical protein [Streptomyces mangrovisoli]OIJ64084.1 hypothetical protein WN71_030605 [Streptomyces mangrovisoli]
MDVAAYGKDYDFYGDDAYSVVKIQRAARLTVKASPNPVKKGKALTVTGGLTRADWNTQKYAGYSGQSVKLQFRKIGTSTYTTVKTVKSASAGALKAAVTASVDGYWRWSYAGNSTTGTVKTAGTYIDVK